MPQFSSPFDFLVALSRKTKIVLALLVVPLVVAAAPVNAKYASMVVDADSGEVLQATNADQENYPASLTKMMTLYLLFDALDRGQVRLADEIPVSAHAAAQAPSKLGLRPGQSLQVEDAILGLCTKSANDAAVAVGEFLGGSETGFAATMTRKAHELGMSQTTFRNASGLPNRGQVSTARDMATLARALLRNHPRQYHYFSTRQFSYNGEEMRNHNHLMDWYDGVDGIKTGYIAASGFNLVASVKRDGRRLIGVVFGGQSAHARDRRMAQLLDVAFAHKAMPPEVEVAGEPQPTEDAAPAPAPKAKVKAATADAADYRDVMKAMAGSHPDRKAAAKAKVARDHTADASGDTEDDDWGIQVGAFGKRTLASHAAGHAMQLLGKLIADGEPKVLRSKGRHAMYRARIVGLPENVAREACRRLAKQHHSCTVVNAALTVALQ